jgi:hypothetical protein
MRLRAANAATGAAGDLNNVAAATLTAARASGIEAIFFGHLAEPRDAGELQSALQKCRTPQAALLRDIIGNPFMPPVAIHPAWLVWRDGTVVKLACAAYDERDLPSGHLDPVRLAVLADATEEAGCSNQQLLAALREPAPRYRGFWALDLLLRKE